MLFRKRSLFLYVRTISDSPRLRSYLKEIQTHALLKKPIEGRLWDEHKLVNTLIKHSPNIEVFNIEGEVDFAFWSQISYAATQGHLTSL